jgi:hypothetical protein
MVHDKWSLQQGQDSNSRPLGHESSPLDHSVLPITHSMVVLFPSVDANEQFLMNYLLGVI